MISDFNIFKQNPLEFEDWSDLMLWQQSSNNLLNKALQQYFLSKIEPAPASCLIDCINNKDLSEVSLIPNLYLKENFIDDTYEVSALFIDNKKDERFFILKKNNEFYVLDISNEYKDLIKKYG